jgi:hypothetical protein
VPAVSKCHEDMNIDDIRALRRGEKRHHGD